MSKFKERQKILKINQKIEKMEFLELVKDDQVVFLKIYRRNFGRQIGDFHIRETGKAVAIAIFILLTIFTILISPIAYPIYYKGKKKFVKDLIYYLNHNYEPKDWFIEQKLRIIIHEFRLENQFPKYQNPKTNFTELEANWFREQFL